MIEVYDSGHKNVHKPDLRVALKTDPKHALYTILDTAQNNTVPRYPTRLYGRLRNKPLSQLDDWEVHYILEQLLGGDNGDGDN